MQFWMLTAMRSGSTYLSNMLHSTGLLHRPERFTDSPHLDISDFNYEYLAPNPNLDPWRIGKEEYTRENCLSHLGYRASFIKRQSCIFKILHEHYRYYKLEDGDRPLVEEIFPDLRYIWLERADIYARTVSAYQFFVSKMPHIYNDKMKKEYDAKTIPWSDEGILDVYHNHIHNCDWKDFLSDATHLFIDYEELIRDPAGVLGKSLKFLGLGRHGLDLRSIVDRQPKFKTERPETQEHIRRLKKLLKV